MQSMSTELALLSWWVTANVRMLGVTVVVVGLFVGVVEYTGRVAPTRRVLAAFAGSRASCCSRVSFTVPIFSSDPLELGVLTGGWATPITPIHLRLIRSVTIILSVTTNHNFVGGSAVYEMSASRSTDSNYDYL
jgi:hypothetical protein